MDEYIKRKDALKVIARSCIDYSAAFSEIGKLPAADVAEVKHGYWFDTYKGGSKKGCSVCHCQADLSKQGKEYCSHCGAMMNIKL